MFLRADIHHIRVSLCKNTRNIEKEHAKVHFFCRIKNKGINLFQKQTHTRNMKRIIPIAVTAAMAFGTPKVWAQNYDETLVPQYTLPSVLTMASGAKVQSIEEWEKTQRPYLMKLLAEHVYGFTPTQKVKATYKLLQENPNALNQKATMQQVLFTFTGNGKTVQATLLAYIPNNRKGRVPVFVGYNFKGNHTISHDKEILYSPYFERMADKTNKRLERGQQTSRWPIELIVENGYAVATMCYHDIYPDQKDGEAQSVVGLFPENTQPNRWQSIGAWAWGSSRIADWLQQQPWADATCMALMGHSRQGKAALWAGAQDTRFRVVISNNSGCGGAALSRREFGETVETINASFPHWFCPNFAKYGKNLNALPVDQHTLLAMMAPRHVYVASAKEDRWADPRGEYLAAYHATDAYTLYGLKGIVTPAMPPVHRPEMQHVGYHIREGIHDVTEYDWKCYIDFCNKAFGRNH